MLLNENDLFILILCAIVLLLWLIRFIYKHTQIESMLRENIIDLRNEIDMLEIERDNYIFTLNEYERIVESALKHTREANKKASETFAKIDLRDIKSADEVKAIFKRDSNE